MTVVSEIGSPSPAGRGQGEGDLLWSYNTLDTRTCLKNTMSLSRRDTPYLRSAQVPLRDGMGERLLRPTLTPARFAKQIELRVRVS